MSFLTVLMVVVAYNVYAQTQQQDRPTINQEFFNGRVSGELASIKDRLSNLESMVKWAATLVVGSVIVQVLGLFKLGKVSHRDERTRSRRDDPDDHEQDNRGGRRRIYVTDRNSDPPED